MNLQVFYQWFGELSKHLPSMSRCQLKNLVLFSLGVVLSESSQLMMIARKVVSGQQAASLERRLRRLLANENWDMEQFMLEWSGCVLTRLKRKRVHLLVDESKLSNRMAVMMVGLGFEGRCIPLAWRCYRANSSKDYPAEGQVGMIVAMLRLIQRAMPAGMTAVVLADRGIGTSPKLCEKIDAMGLNYLFRITKQSKIITADAELTIYDQVKPGTRWEASGKVFKKRGRIPAHVHAIWDKDCAQPWLLVTNDRQISAYEYAKRNWQEQSFRDLKSGGWNWSRSFLRCPQRMTRLIAILTVAYAWMISLGCRAVEEGLARPPIRNKNDKLRRQWSLFKEGLQYFANKIIPNSVCPRLYFAADRRLC